jgi:N-acylneuraminate cytidylyltransferase/CMP-N,N'-diacetyllegionaminic acid synthase
MTLKKQGRVLAVIIARGGSKGLPLKNIRLLAGKPLIAYTIDAALQARLLDRTVVSTDDRQIAEIARQYGAEIPFLRPPELAQDETTVYPVLSHAVQWLENCEGYRPDYVMLLQPTSPLRTAGDIDNAIVLALERNADGVVSLCETKHHPYWTKRVTEDGQVVEFAPLDRAYDRRQELPRAYALNGAIYLCKREILLECQTFYTDRTYAYIMPIEHSLDIDTPWDLHLAELILQGKASHERG